MNLETRQAKPEESERLSATLGIPAAELGQALPSLKVCACPSGSVIVCQGEIGREVYVVLKGQVLVRRTRWLLIQRELARLGPGDLFGEISFLVPAPRTASVVAEGDCEVFRIGAEDLRRLLERRPELAARIEEMARQRFYALSAAG